MGKRTTKASRTAALAGGASAIALALCLPAQAQFVCSGYTDGSGPFLPPLLLLSVDGAQQAAGTGTASGTETRTVNDGGALAWDFGSMACGRNARASAADSTAIGNNAFTGPAAGKSVAVGANAYAGTMAYVGEGGGDTDAYSTAVGAYAASGLRATAVGAEAFAFKDSQAFGYNAQASGERSVAIGVDSSASGNNSVVVGHAASDGGHDNQVVIGHSAGVARTDAYGAPLPGLNVALGQGSVASRGALSYYAAYGYGRPAYSIGEVAVGTADGNRQITGVAPGSAGTDAVNVDQLRGAIDNATTGTGTGGPIIGQNDAGASFPIAIGTNATAAGYGAIAAGARSVALGYGSVADRDDTVSFGTKGNERILANVGAGTQTTDAVNLGQLNALDARLSTLSGDVTGVSTRVTNLEGAPVGPTVPARTYPVAADNGAGLPAPVAGGRNALAVGQGATANAENAVAVGNGSVADQANTVSFGSVGNARRLANVASGIDDTDAVNVGQMRAAIAALPEAPYVPVSGNNASGLPKPTSTGADALGIGYGAKADGQASVAVGRASAGGARSAALGDGAGASGNDALALGALATASGPSSVAAGAGASAGGARSTAVGAGASANADGSTAIGAGARATRANQVAVGTGSSTYTLGGVASAASRAQQSGPAYFATTDAQGNLAATTFDTSRLDVMDGRITGVDRRVTTVEDRLGTVEGRVGGVERNVAILRNDVRKASEGVSIAMAMAGVQLPAGKNYALSANWGNFMGENGFAATGAARLTDSTFVHAGFGVGASGGTVGGRAGITLGW